VIRVVGALPRWGAIQGQVPHCYISSPAMWRLANVFAIVLLQDACAINATVPVEGFIGPIVGMGITGFNNLGFWSLDSNLECAEKCLQEPRCKSFDWGARGAAKRHCFLSTADRASAGSAYSKWTLYDYFEKEPGESTTGSSTSAAPTTSVRETTEASTAGGFLPPSSTAGPPTTAALVVTATTAVAATTATTSMAMATLPALVIDGYDGPFKGMKLTGYNDLGRYVVKDLEDCARQCTNKRACMSFEYGQKTCLLSSATRNTAGLDAFASSLIFDYYEKNFPSIADVVTGRPELSALSSVLEAADMQPLLAGHGPVTLFAPVNGALQAHGVGALDSEAAQRLIQKHLVHGQIAEADLQDGAKLLTSASALATVSVSGDKVMVEQAEITESIICENGIVHLVDGVVKPSDQQERLSDILSAVGLSKFKEMLQVEGFLMHAITSGPQRTVLVPSDAAIDAFLRKTKIPFDLLKESLGTVRRIAQAHILLHDVKSADVPGEGDSYPTFAGTNVSMFRSPAGVFVEGETGEVAVVSHNDVVGTDATVHVIDAVLVTPWGSYVEEDEVALLQASTGSSESDRPIVLWAVIAALGACGCCLLGAVTMLCRRKVVEEKQPLRLSPSVVTEDGVQIVMGKPCKDSSEFGKGSAMVDGLENGVVIGPVGA